LIKIISGRRSGSTCGASKPSPARTPCAAATRRELVADAARLRRFEQRRPPQWLIDGSRSRRCRTRSKGCRPLATGRAAELAAAAADGVVVTRVDGHQPGDLRDLAIAVRQQPGVHTVVLGA